MSHYGCPECSNPTSVIETRRYHSILRRRRKCVSGHRFSTLEISLEAPTKIKQLIIWLTKQNLEPEIAQYAQEQLVAIMHGIDEDD